MTIIILGIYLIGIPLYQAYMRKFAVGPEFKFAVNILSVIWPIASLHTLLTGFIAVYGGIMARIFLPGSKEE